MAQWSYPAGAIINGVLTEQRTVRGPLPVTIRGVQHSPAIFTVWSREDLAELGLKEFIEESVPQEYEPGIPEDTETDLCVTRTYPNKVLRPPVPDPVPVENLDLAAISYTQADALMQAQTVEALKFAVLDVLGL